MMDAASPEVLCDLVPVVRLPTLREVLLHVLGETFMVEDELRPIALGVELETNEGVDPFGPGLHAPRLDHPFARRKLDVAPDDVSAENRECGAFDPLTARGCSGH